MLGIVLATNHGIAHLVPGREAERALEGPRFTALDYRDGVAIAAASGHGVWMHHGDEWRLVWEGDARIVRIAPDGVAYIGASPPTVLRSSDRGETWIEVTTVPNILRHERSRISRGGLPDPQITALVFPRNFTLLAISPLGTWISRDRGGTWMRGDQIQHSARSEPLEAEDLDPRLLGLWEHPEVTDRVYALARGGVFRSDDGGESWRRSRPGPDRVAAGSLALLPGAQDTLLLSTLAPNEDGVEGRATLLRSSTGGRSWEAVTLGEESSWPRAPLVGAVDGEPGMLFAIAGGSAWGSHDGGTRWLPLADDVPEAYAMVPAL